MINAITTSAMYRMSAQALIPIFGAICYYLISLWNVLFPYKKAIDLNTGKSVLFYLYMYKWFGYCLRPICKNKIYDNIYVKYSSTKRKYKTIIKGKFSEIPTILKIMATYKHMYPKILPKLSAGINLVTVGTIDIYPMMKNFVKYNVDIRLEHILKINKINYTDKTIKIEYYHGDKTTIVDYDSLCKNISDVM